MSLEQHWYRSCPSVLSRVLWPLSLLFSALVRWRRWCYQRGYFKQHRCSIPVIVVGNIAVGGTGKTPLVTALVAELKAQGLKPGLVSRGYGGQADKWPQNVTLESSPAVVGDEAVLLVQRCRCPMVVAPNRVAAVEQLLANNALDVVISDDGLQHYAMGRDVEIVVIDGQRQLGNGYLLPAGPLREGSSRLSSVDFVVINGAHHHAPLLPETFSMTLTAESLVNLCDASRQKPLHEFSGQRVHAIAGIGHPQRFFSLLRAAGVEVIEHPFTDHHAYVTDDLQFSECLPILMTEKDAVKCRDFAADHHWVLPVKATLSNHLFSNLLNKINKNP
jgi:tetraacyldisaccharide 4'-kinase